MIYSTLLLCLVSLAQSTPELPPTGIPEGTTIFTVTFKDGGDVKVVSAALRAKDGFLKEYDARDRPAAVDYIEDTPWKPMPPQKLLTQNITEIEPETYAKQSQRYKDSGYTHVDTPTGAVWVASETVARAARATELREDLEQRRVAHYAAYEAQVSGAPVAEESPGFVSLWGRHVVIAVLALVMMVVTVKVCF